MMKRCTRETGGRTDAAQTRDTKRFMQNSTSSTLIARHRHDEDRAALTHGTSCRHSESSTVTGWYALMGLPQANRT